jgi:transformation/transcription domain-associated protein
MFYPCRGQFVQQMVQSLARIGLLPQAPVENRKLAIDMVELIINWEKKKISEAKVKEEEGATTPMVLEENTTDGATVSTATVAGKKRAASEGA